MNYTQNEKIKQVTEGTLVVGVDIASEVHYARAFDWRGIELAKVFRFTNDLEGFESFYRWLNANKDKWNKTKVMIGAEPTGHYWFTLASFVKETNIELVLVNPYHVKQCKELDDNSQRKTDLKDPKTIAKLVIDGRYNIPYIPEGVYAELRTAMACRLRITKELNATKNRIERWLKIYFPEYKRVYGKFTALSSIVVLKEAPLPSEILELGVEGINAKWREQKIRAVGMKRAKTLYEMAKRSVGCGGGIGAKIEVELLLEDYETKNKQYEKVMTSIEELISKVPYVENLLDIKGVGIVTVAGFVAEVGDIRRFKSPKQIQKLAGLAITENSSGKHKGQTTISKRGRSRLRAVLFQAVMPLVAKNEEFKSLHEYYTNRNKNPLKKKQSIVAVACKLIRVFYTILIKGVVYDKEKLLNDIVRPQEMIAA